MSIGLGTPDGAKNFKNLTIPCLYIAIRVTPIKIKKAIEKVTMIWLVQVKLQGNIPKRFPTKIKRKSVKIKEKYFMPSLPILSPIIQHSLGGKSNFLRASSKGALFGLSKPASSEVTT